MLNERVEEVLQAACATHTADTRLLARDKIGPATQAAGFVGRERCTGTGENRALLWALAP